MKLGVLFAVLLAIDQITKAYAGRDFFIGPVHWHLVRNYGLSFGLDFGLGWNLAVLLAAGLVFVGLIVRRRLPLGRAWLVLIVVGAISNVFDRIALGYVRDILDFGLGFTVNLSDVYIFLGILGIIFFPGPDPTAPRPPG